MANFYLKPYIPDKKAMRTIKNYKENQPEHKELLELLKEPQEESLRVNITVSLLGIRNLRFDCIDPIIKIRLSH